MDHKELQEAVYHYLLPIVATQCQVRNGLIEGSIWNLEATLKEIQCIGLIDWEQEEKLLLVLKTEL